jgi:hypothetical protein
MKTGKHVLPLVIKQVNSLDRIKPNKIQGDVLHNVVRKINNDLL